MNTRKIYIISFVILFIFGCNFNIDNKQIHISLPLFAESNTQIEIKKIENFIKEFQKSGIFIKVINKGKDNFGTIKEIYVDEYAWNNLPYDAKKATENMFLRYYQIGHVTIIFRGYRTGQILTTISRNFRI